MGGIEAHRVRWLDNVFDRELGRHRFNIHDSLIKWVGGFIAMIRMYHAFKGRKEHWLPSTMKLGDAE